MVRLKPLKWLSLFAFFISFSSFKFIKKTAYMPEKQVFTDTISPNLLTHIIQSDTSLSFYLKNAADLKIQIIYSKIDRNKDNEASFKDFFYHSDPNAYFYPASTVKLPVALLALEKLHLLNRPDVTSSTTMITEKNYGAQTEVLNDPTSVDGRPTVENYVKKIFLVSDNDAMNRLYEFVGQQNINESLHAKGYSETQIIHRLNIALSEDENRHTNPIYFIDPLGNKLLEQSAQFNKMPYLQRNDKIGKAYLSEGKLVETPLDFSKKNKINLYSLHNILKSVMFPELFSKKQRFNISDKDLNLVRKYLSEYPTESDFPAYPAPEFYPAYCKFLLYGADKSATIHPNIRIFNKVGDAYGFLLDVAYVADFKNNIEFMLSAVIYCNADGILNDDKYEYETIGLPFLKKLGLSIYTYELNRKRKFLPDLKKFKINYSQAPSNK
jgi:hypothetical protein